MLKMRVGAILNFVKAQLERIFGIPDRLEDDIFFAVKSFKHEDGRYYQVVISYDDDNAEAAKLAARIANNLPDEWDDRSLRKLKGNKEAIATVKQDRAKHKKEKISKSVQDVREAYEVGKEIADLVFNVLERIF